jgi:hypothetical protein
MRISDLIRELQKYRDGYGDLPVYIAQGGVEYGVKVEYSESVTEIDENYVGREKPAERRFLLKGRIF